MINVNILFFTIELILFLLSSFVCVFPKKREQIQTGITLSESLCLRGISIGVIIFSHLIQFSNIITTVHWLKILFVPFMHITYVFVALFFFLSGYGNYLSIKKSVNKWSWLNKRVVTLFVFFIPGFMVNIFINKASYSTTKEIIFDLFTFTYKPYSLWFFKVIFIFYLLSFIFYRFVVIQGRKNG